MFNLTGSELIFLLIAGLVVLGPERLPGVIRRAGRVYGEIKRASQTFEKEFRDTFQQPIDEITGSLKDLSDGFGKIDTEPSPPMRPEMPAPPTEMDDGTEPRT